MGVESTSLRASVGTVGGLFRTKYEALTMARFAGVLCHLPVVRSAGEFL